MRTRGRERKREEGGDPNREIRCNKIIPRKHSDPFEGRPSYVSALSIVADVAVSRREKRRGSSSSRGRSKISGSPSKALDAPYDLHKAAGLLRLTLVDLRSRE